MTEAYWRAPRRLARLVEDGDLAGTAYSILNYVAQSGADRPEGFSTTYAALASVFHVNARTVKRHLLRLRELRLVEYKVRQGQHKPFRIRLDTLALVDQLRTPETAKVSEVVSEATSDTPPSLSDRDPAPDQGSRPLSTSDRSRARAETETENAVEDSAIAPSSTARDVPLSRAVAASSSQNSDGPLTSSVVEQIEQLKRAALTRDQASDEGSDS